MQVSLVSSERHEYIYFREDLGWFSVFMLIGVPFYQPQIGNKFKTIINALMTCFIKANLWLVEREPRST